MSELRLGPLPTASGGSKVRQHLQPQVNHPLAFHRPDQVSVLDSYQYDDGCEPCGNDTFSREPAIVKFSSPFTRECWAGEDIQ